MIKVKVRHLVGFQPKSSGMITGSLLLLGMDYFIKNYKSVPPYTLHSKVS